VCNINSPEPQEGGGIWTFLVCNFVEAGNYNSEHPFGDNKDAACAKTYQPVPPPQPISCATRTCTDTAVCPSPIDGATCNTGTGAWEFTGNVAARQLHTDPKYLPCKLKIIGDFSAGPEKLNLTTCGSIEVTGNVLLTGSPVIDMEFESRVQSVGDYIPFISATATTGGPWATPIAQNVFAPTVVLCVKAVTGSNTSYLFFYDCAVASPNIVLPDGGTVTSASSGSESTRPPQPGDDGDINDPDLQVNPRGNIDGITPPGEAPNSGNETSGNRLPGWAIFLIVLACIIVVAVIILLIFLLFSSSGHAERF